MIAAIIFYALSGLTVAGVAFSDDIEKGERADGDLSLFLWFVVLWPAVIAVSVGVYIGRKP